MTEGGIKQLWRQVCRGATVVEGLGKGKVVGWGRHSVAIYLP